MGTSKDTKKDPFDTDIQACFTMDCTGLIPSLPRDDVGRESYEDLYPYVTKAQRVDEDVRG